VTRLTRADIAGLGPDLPAYDGQLRTLLGCDLFGLACRAAGRSEARARRRMAGLTAAVVPIDSGQGILPGFAATVEQILRHLACPSFVTSCGDVAGLAEAYERDADLVLLADDYRFIALALRTRRVVDNAAATARGFVTGLELMAGGLRGRDVLLLGCGAVGAAAAAALLERGATVGLFDLKPERAAHLQGALAAGASDRVRSDRVRSDRVRIEPELPQALARYRLLFDATPAAGIITEEHVSAETLVAAPGVPLGLTAGATCRLRGRLLHDPLQTGVATMLMEALRP